MLRDQGYVFSGKYKPRKNPFRKNDYTYKIAVIVMLSFALGLWILIYKIGT